MNNELAGWSEDLFIEDGKKKESAGICRVGRVMANKQFFMLNSCLYL